AAVAAGATGDPTKIGQAENVLSQSLRSLFAVSENYPDLKAISAFTNLQETLTATEDKIEFSRRFYNGNVRDYNTKLQTLPTSLIAGMLGFKAFGFFQADEGDRAVPRGRRLRHPGLRRWARPARPHRARPPPPSPARTGTCRSRPRSGRRSRCRARGWSRARSASSWPSR